MKGMQVNFPKGAEPSLLKNISTARKKLTKYHAVDELKQLKLVDYVLCHSTLLCPTHPHLGYSKKARISAMTSFC